MSLSEIHSPTDWNALASALPGAHVLQSWEWGDFKSRHGWSARRFTWSDEGRGAAASLLTRRIRIQGFAARLAVCYVPKGPLLDWSDARLRSRVLADLASFARRQGAIFLKVDPDVTIGTGVPGSESDRPSEAGLEVARWLARQGWRFSAEQIQFPNTVQVDLTRGEGELLAAMKPKTRYNVRLAARKGVVVQAPRPSGGELEATLDRLYRMYAETAERDGFLIRTQDYYRDAWGSFVNAGLAQPVIACVDDEPVSALILFTFAGRAWTIYGMSRAAHRDKMPNHLLQWEAMHWARAHGCRVYDLWGAPTRFNESDPLWGVWRFKEGFGGQVVRHLGAWDLPLSRPLYWLYTSAMPRVLEFMRRRTGSGEFASP